MTAFYPPHGIYSLAMLSIICVSRSQLIWFWVTEFHDMQNLLSPKNCAELNSDFIVRFILVRFVIVTKGNRI